MYSPIDEQRPEFFNNQQTEERDFCVVSLVIAKSVLGTGLRFHGKVGSIRR